LLFSSGSSFSLLLLLLSSSSSSSSSSPLIVDRSILLFSSAPLPSPFCTFLLYIISFFSPLRNHIFFFVVIFYYVLIQAVPWLRSLVAGLSPRRPWFAPGSIHVGFVVDKVALGQVFLRVLRFSPVSISFHRRSPNSYHLGMCNMLTEVGIHAWVLDSPHLQKKKCSYSILWPLWFSSRRSSSFIFPRSVIRNIFHSIWAFTTRSFSYHSRVDVKTPTHFQSRRPHESQYAKLLFWTAHKNILRKLFPFVSILQK
jgi:hypothetical protein